MPSLLSKIFDPGDAHSDAGVGITGGGPGDQPATTDAGDASGDHASSDASSGSDTATTSDSAAASPAEDGSSTSGSESAQDVGVEGDLGLGVTVTVEADLGGGWTDLEGTEHGWESDNTLTVSTDTAASLLGELSHSEASEDYSA